MTWEPRNSRSNPSPLFSSEGEREGRGYKKYLAGAFLMTWEPRDGRSSRTVFREWVSSKSWNQTQIFKGKCVQWQSKNTWMKFVLLLWRHNDFPVKSVLHWPSWSIHFETPLLNLHFGIVLILSTESENSLTEEILWRNEFIQVTFLTAHSHWNRIMGNKTNLIQY